MGFPGGLKIGWCLLPIFSFKLNSMANDRTKINLYLKLNAIHFYLVFISGKNYDSEINNKQ